MSRLFAVVGFVIVLVGLAQFWPVSANADDGANIATYRKLIDSINKGDVAGALALFTDDAELSSPQTCAPNRHTRRAPIQNQLQPDRSLRPRRERHNTGGAGKHCATPLHGH